MFDNLYTFFFGNLFGYITFGFLVGVPVAFAIVFFGRRKSNSIKLTEAEIKNILSQHEENKVEINNANKDLITQLLQKALINSQIGMEGKIMIELKDKEVDLNGEKYKVNGSLTVDIKNKVVENVKQESRKALSKLIFKGGEIEEE